MSSVSNTLEAAALGARLAADLIQDAKASADKGHKLDASKVRLAVNELKEAARKASAVILEA